jgi:excisionase family DNA binding protein
MSRHELIKAPDDLAYTVADLAARWQCGESTVRNLIKRGKLATFRIGTLIRISAIEVERFECQNTQCSDSAADTPLSIETSKERADEERSMPKIGRARKPRHADYGNGATIHHGPWAD